MKVGVYGGEAFPVYEISSSGNEEIEIDVDTFKRWKEAFDQFSAVQKEIVNELKKQGHSDKVWSNGIWNGWNI